MPETPIVASSIPARDLMSVGSRISWSAICAGSVLALALCLLLTTLGTAVGVSLHDRLSSSTLQTGSVAWAVLITCVSLFVGGMVTSLMTVGENKTEGVLHGILTWGLVVAVFFVLGAAGIRSGINLSGNMGGTQVASIQVQDAGMMVNTTGMSQDELIKRYTWYSFAGTWLSMLAAALGAYLGAGPTFRVIPVVRATIPAVRTS